MIFPISLYSLEKLSTPGSDLWWTLNMCIFHANPLFYKTQTNGKNKQTNYFFMDLQIQFLFCDWREWVALCNLHAIAVPCKHLLWTEGGCGPPMTMLGMSSPFIIMQTQE